jgi:hypothetical protein
MKKLILSAVFTAFTLASQAGNEKTCSADKGASSCCAEATPSAKKTKASQMTKDGKATCSSSNVASKQATTKRPLQSPKAFADAR